VIIKYVTAINISLILVYACKEYNSKSLSYSYHTNCEEITLKYENPMTYIWKICALIIIAIDKYKQFVII